MHDLSLPPSDRTELPAASAILTGDALRTAVRALEVSNADVARGIGKSDGTISMWLAGKYAGDNVGIEAAVREWMHDRTVVQVSGVPTTDTEVSRVVARKCEETMANGEFTVVVGPAGIGKSRAQSLYLRRHLRAFGMRCLPWHSTINALADDICQAAEIYRIEPGKKRWDVIVERTRGSGRLLLIDDAHELSPRCLQCAVDYHDDTGNPLVLFGLPALKQRLLKDERRASRVGEFVDLSVRDARPLVEHLVDALAPDAGDEREALVGLGVELSGGLGVFRSVEKELKLAARNRLRKLDTRRVKAEDLDAGGRLKWVPAFRAAHLRLLRRAGLN